MRHLAKMAGRFARPRVGTTRRPWLTGALLVLIVGVVASGCDWTLFGYDAANTRNSPDTGISTSNVRSLIEILDALLRDNREPGCRRFAHRVRRRGLRHEWRLAARPYGGGTLAAFSATACTSPTSDCTPQWVAPTASKTAPWQVRRSSPTVRSM